MSDDTAPDFGAHLGFSSVSESGEEVALEVTPGREHCNGSGILHGGFLSAMLDSVTGWAVHARDAAGGGESMWPHVQMNVQYLQAAVPGRRIEARGRCLTQGGRIATAEGELIQRGRVVARATSTHARVARA